MAKDTRTPPLLDAIYEQIIRGAAGYDDLVDCSEDQVITDFSIASVYSHAAHDEIPEKFTLRLQNIYAQFVQSQNCLREQLELSRARQQKLHADLLAAEHERESLKELVASLEESSDEKRRRRKRFAASAKALCAEAEETVSKLRADLKATMDRVHYVQEQLDRQTELASGKDHIIQSITEESQVAHVRLKYAEDKIAHLDAKLQRERDRRLRKTKELLDEQARIQNRHESEIRCLKQEAQDAQQQLDTLQDADGQSPLNQPEDHSYRQPTTWPYYTGQPPLPPEQIHDPDIPPDINLEFSLRSTKSSPYSPSQNQEDSSTHQIARLLQTSADACFDPATEVTQDHRAALKELFERMRQEESESIQDAVKRNCERVESRLREELAKTKELLHLAEEEVLTMHRDIGQSRETLQEVKPYITFLQSGWEVCKVMLREAQDAWRASITKLAEVVELLRESQAESESWMAEAVESRFRCSQVTFLCAALQERVTDLEGKVKKLKYPTTRPVHTDSARSCCPTDTGPGLCVRPIYAVLYAHVYFQGSDSIWMTVPPLVPNLLDSSLPPTPSSSLYFSPQKCLEISSACAHIHLFGPKDTRTGAFAVYSRFSLHIQTSKQFQVILMYKIPIPSEFHHHCRPDSTCLCHSHTPIPVCSLLQIHVQVYMHSICAAYSAYIFKVVSDFEAFTYDSDLQDSGSIYMTVPPLFPRLLDLSLPPPSSQSDPSLYLSYEVAPCTAVGHGNANHESTSECSCA